MRKEYDFSNCEIGKHAHRYAGLTEAPGLRRYPIAEASRLTGVSSQAIGSWVRRAASAHQPHAQGSGRPGPCLCFLDLVDLLVVGRLLEVGLPLRNIRQAHAQLIEGLHTVRPFSREDLFTQGVQILRRFAQEARAPELRPALSRAHKSSLLRLQDEVEYDPDSLLARRWHVAEGVLIDPERGYGHPIMAESGIAAAVLAAAHEANELNAGLVADWYGVSVRQIELAVAFDRQMRKRAA